MSDSVGIKLLKENLSAYVARAAKGERIVVTDRGREVAELVPLSDARRAIQDLIAEGILHWNGRVPVLEEPPLDIDADVAGAVLEDRG